MTEEEYFRKTYQDFCYGDRPLSPYWDFFQDGVEFGYRQSEKRIEELEKGNAELKEHIEKADEIIKDILNVCCSNCINPHCVDCKHRKIVLKAENFLKEIEK